MERGGPVYWLGRRRSHAQRPRAGRARGPPTGGVRLGGLRRPPLVFLKTHGRHARAHGRGAQRQGAAARTPRHRVARRDAAPGRRADDALPVLAAQRAALRRVDGRPQRRRARGARRGARARVAPRLARHAAAHGPAAPGAGQDRGRVRARGRLPRRAPGRGEPRDVRGARDGVLRKCDQAAAPPRAASATSGAQQRHPHAHPSPRPATVVGGRRRGAPGRALADRHSLRDAAGLHVRAVRRRRAPAVLGFDAAGDHPGHVSHVSERGGGVCL
mmetsp:Transcript_31430/g.97026  ORF Transcript_31430/g.97026 Transcript_31430/m.97026 type:complete len:273 (-) Transcript_31430:36-854(-)